MINGFDDSDAIKAVLNWNLIEGNEWFDASFVSSLSDAVEEYGSLTDGQRNALENIIRKCGIDIAANC